MVERPAFASVVVDRKKANILGCHVVGERAVEIAQVAAIAMSAGLGVVDLARVPQAFPTYTGNLVYAPRVPRANWKSTWTGMGAI